MSTPVQNLDEARLQARFSNQSLLLQNVTATTTEGFSYAARSNIIEGDIASPTWIDANGGVGQVDQATVDQLVAASTTVRFDGDQILDSYNRAYNLSRLVSAYYGPPEVLLTRLVNPPNMSDFVHAKPHQLSLLQPLLKFFMVDNDGQEEEIFFSDYITEKKSLELASLRRTGGTESVLSRRSQEGTNVGIKSFQWDYTNKHEGDRILKADLELYFGSLAELSNLNYLQFLFVNGRSNPLYPPIKSTSATGLSPAYLAYQNMRDELDIIVGKYPDNISNNDFTYLNLDDGILLDYRKLKVACGWSVPKGSQEKLLRMFTGDSSSRRTKLNNFLNAIKNTQRIITLNLTDYQVNFSQEGPTTVSISYIGSADNYMAQIASDVFGTFNSALDSDYIEEFFTKEEIPEDLQKALADFGYLYHQQKPLTETYLKHAYDRTATGGAKPFGEPLGVHFAGLKFDEMVLRKEVTVATLRLNGLTAANAGRTLTWATQQLDEAQQKLATTERVIELYLKKTESRRFAAMLATLIQADNVYKMEIVHKKGGPEVTVDAAYTTAETLREAAEEYLQQLGRPASGQDRTLAKLLKGYIPDNMRRIYYVKFGDFLKTACNLAGLREDIKFIVGSINTNQFRKGGQAGTPPGTPNDYISIYDLPISLEYIMQFFYDKVVETGRSSYPMKNFVNDLMSLTSNLINNITGYSIQTNLSMTVYTSYDFVQEKILFPFHVENYQQRIGSLIYKPVKQKIHNHYIIFAKQMDNTKRYGNKTVDEVDGIYHYALGADRGLAREFNFKKIDMPQRQAMLIEAANYAKNTLDQYTAQSRALILPQDIEIVMFGNTLHRNGDLLYVDSRAALGEDANAVLTLGGYYRVVRSIHKITPGGYTTTLQCKFELPTGPVPPGLARQGP